MWIPNALTALRILLLPAVITLLPRVESSPGAVGPVRLALVGLFFLLAATDWLDGYLARRLGATSRWGSVLDAAADRLALLLPLFYLAFRPHAAFSPVPLWIPLWLLVLDVGTGAAWLMTRTSAGRSAPVSHTRAGRAAVWILFALVLWIFVGLSFAGVVTLALVGLTLATVSAALHLRRSVRVLFTRRHQ